MKEIPVSRGKFAIVDDDDYERLSKHKWYCNVYGYALRDITVSRKKSHIWMHRAVIDTPPGMDTDHINGNRLDNRKCNLRACSASENMRNRPKQTNNTSGYKGVFWSKPAQKWRAQIVVNKKAMHLGLFVDPKDAYEAYKAAAEKYFGEFIHKE